MLQVISIILDPYYRNQTKVFTSDEYHAGVFLMRIPTNLFGLPKKHKFNVSIVNAGFNIIIIFYMHYNVWPLFQSSSWLVPNIKETYCCLEK